MSFFDNMNRFQKNKLILTVSYFLMNLVTLIYSFRLSLDNLRLLVDLSKFIPYIRYFALFGMILFLGLIVMQYMEIYPLKKSLEKKEQEIHLLKSRLYDFEENERKQAEAGNQKQPGK